MSNEPFQNSSPKLTGISLPFLLALALFIGLNLGAQEKTQTKISEPDITSIFPMGGRQRSIVTAELRGSTLEGARGVLFDGQGCRAEIRKVERIRLEEKQAPSANQSSTQYRVLLRITVDSSAPIGVHWLRLVSEEGVSNPLPFLVGEDPVIEETDNPHNTPASPQPVKFPVVINGRIGKAGEFDYYSFQATQGQELDFEVFAKPYGDTIASKGSKRGFDARLALYEATGSWFDSRQVTSLAFCDDPILPSINTNPRLTYKFKKDGRYLLEVSAYSGETSMQEMGGPDHTYQLRIVESGRSSFTISELGRWSFHDEWYEQTFDRKIDPDRLQKLRSRSVSGIVDESPLRVPEFTEAEGTAVTLQSSSSPPQYAALNPTPSVKRAHEETAYHALEVTVPAILQGSIDHPGDVDTFSFKVMDDQSLAFEIETPDSAPPQFNPVLTVLDKEGGQVLTNVYRRVGRIPNYRKTVQPKSLYTFKTGGDFRLQIRDVTSRYGNPSFRYRILVRPQIPHLGEVRITEELVKETDMTRTQLAVDRINLHVGTPKKLTVLASLEEGFVGDVVLRVKGLPDGVEALTESQNEPDNPVLLDEGERDQYLPRLSKASLLLIASTTALSTSTPQPIRIILQPVLWNNMPHSTHFRGELGLPFLGREISLMVVNPGNK